MPDETFITTIANQLLTCWCDQLELNPAPPAECCLLTGDLTIHDINAQNGLDKTCCPGFAYVRLGSMFPSSNFPAPDTEPGKGNGCFPVSWAVELTMGIVRCVPGMGQPSGPDCVDWTLAAQHDANDMDAMRKALCCWQPQLSRGRLWLAGASTVTLSADCVERQMPVLVQIPKCC